MLATSERQSSKRANQIGTLLRPGYTRWSSNYDFVRDLLDMYNASCIVVGILKTSGQSQAIRGQTLGAHKVIRRFEFIFVLHLMDNIMGITDILCQALQRKSLDILNAMKLFSTTKVIL